MTVPDNKTLDKLLSEQILGQQAVIDDICKRLNAPDRKTSSIILSGPPGTGKTQMIKKLAERFAPVVLQPLTSDELCTIADHMIDKNEALNGRRAEAKAVIREIIAEGCTEPDSGARGLRQLVSAMAAAGASDLKEAISKQLPAYGQRVSRNRGEKLAESFTAGTAEPTHPLRPLKIKSKQKSGRVGFFALN